MDRVLEKKPFYRRRQFWYYSGAGAVFFVLILLIGLDAGSKLNVDAEKITISTVAEGDFQEFIPVTGTILPRTTFYLDAILGGVVATKYVEEGAMLKKGDKILQLSNTNVQLNALQQETFTYQQINDARNTRLQIEQNSNALQNALVAANYNLMNATQIHARQEAMWEKKLISEQDFQQAENNYHLAIQQQTQTADIQAQTFIQSFQSTTSAEVRLDSLARLFGLGGQYVQQARDLFLSLSQQDRLALLSPQSPENVGSQLVTVIEGVYQYVSDTSDGNTLLATMVGELEQVSATGASSLATEITFWLQAREWAQAGRYEDAVDQYNDVINRSEKRGHLNITAQFERGVAHVDLGHYDAALADFEVVLTSDRDREAAVVEQILGEPPLAARWAGQSAQYPSLSAVLPTLTPTPLVINTHTPTPTVTSTATRTSTATPSLIATTPPPTVSPSPTPVPTVGGSPIVYGALTYGSGRQALTNGTTLYSGFLLYFTVRNISDRELTMNFRGLAIRDPTKPGDQRFINGINLFKGTLYPSEVVEIEVRLSSLSCSGCDLSCSDCDSFPSISASQWDPGSKVYVPEGWMPSSLRYRVTIQPATATPLPMGEITGVTLRGGRSHSILIDVTYSGVDTNATYSACILGTNYSATCPTSNFRPASNSGTFSLEALIDNSYCLGGAFKVENLMIALRRYDTYTGVLSSPITWTFPFEYTWCSGP